jgi:AcrR family transcriptional regulator
MTTSPTSRTRGRPRSEQAHRAILKAALVELGKTGFRLLTVDSVAARAGVGKMTIYRRWPNKAALVMDAFLTLVGPETEFPAAPRALERIRLQLHIQAQFFQGRFGGMIRALLGEAQFDPDLAQAFRDRWIIPRRQMPRQLLEEAVRQGDLRADIDVETAIDALYGPLYYRLQIGTGPLSSAFAETVFQQVLTGLRAPPGSSRYAGSRAALR